MVMHFPIVTNKHKREEYLAQERSERLARTIPCWCRGSSQMCNDCWYDLSYEIDRRRMIF